MSSKLSVFNFIVTYWRCRKSIQALHSIVTDLQIESDFFRIFCLNPVNAKLNPICYLLALLGAHHILHVSRIRVKHYPLMRNQDLHLVKFDNIYWKYFTTSGIFFLKYAKKTGVFREKTTPICR